MLQGLVGTLTSNVFRTDMVSSVLTSIPLKRYMLASKQAFSEVVTRLVGLETTNTNIGSTMFRAHHAVLPNQQVAQNLSADPVIISLSDRVEKLEVEVGFVKSDGDDVEVSFMGVRFSSEGDIQAFFEKLGSGVYEIPAGLVWDSYAIFSELFREIFNGGGHKLGFDKMSKLGTYDDVNHVEAACAHGVPSFFDGQAGGGHTSFYTTGKEGKKSRFRNIPSYAQWGPVGTVKTCVRNAARANLDRLVRSSRQNINTVVNSEVKMFLLNMLDTSRAFVDAVFEFLTEEYTALSLHFPDEKVCWDFACLCVEHVFKYEFEMARSVLRNPDLRSQRIGVQVMWTALRTIAVQESFLRVGFKNHSSLASAYSCFLLTQYQTPASELQEVKKKVTAFASKFEDQDDAMADLKRKFKVVEGMANSAHKSSSKKKKSDDD